MTTLYDKYGGQKFCDDVVCYFYDNLVLKDPKVNYFFKNTDMKKQKVMQGSFVAFALGGPIKYSGRGMKKAHEGLKITKEHFDIIVQHLAAALTHFKMSSDDINAVAQKLTPLKDEIVSA